VGRSRNLFGWEIDSERLFRRFVDEHRQELIQAVEQGSLFTATEVSALLDTALPGMNEMGALLAIQDGVESGKYSTIVVDTAPFGHTLRLFGLPAQFANLLNLLELAGERDQVLAQHFGGNVRGKGRDFIASWREKLKRINEAFESASVFLVTSAEEFALNESLRCIRELEDADPPMRLSGVVLNRVISNAGKCETCKAKALAGKNAQRGLEEEYRGVELFVGEDPGFPVLGAAELKKFADAVFGRKTVKWKSRAPLTSKKLSTPKMIPTEWPLLWAPLTFVLGKGGVGKTTVSAALGFHARQNSRNQDEIEICSVDPAPSLDDVFQTLVDDTARPVLGDPGFRASEMDSVALYKSWVAEMRAEIDSATSVRRSGVQVDLSYEKRLFSKLLEIVPPGLDEVLAIFRVMEMSEPRSKGSKASSRKVVIDMAPTGHALELLRTPERILVWSRLLLKSLASHRKLALAREAAVRIAELEVRARELSQALATSGAVVYAVMLPEPLPDRETERLMGELGKLGIKPEAVFVNRVEALRIVARRSGKSSGACGRCLSSAEWQSRVLSGLKAKLQVKTVYVVPAFEHGPAAKRGLREITRKLWRLI
jgi:arsenite-transporting ATPase